MAALVPHALFVYYHKLSIFAHEAVACDEKNRKKDAFHFYLQALAFIEPIRLQEKNQARRQLILDKAIDYVERAEILKEELKKI